MTTDFSTAEELAAQIIALLTKLNDIGDTAIGLGEILTPAGSISRGTGRDGTWTLHRRLPVET